ncbi:MAG: hypothetical protein P1U86_00975 [Verrucomicrobiales bacterium]|nr:hypothetical protein [Verrucomicrobiales bacterium]
MPFAKGWNHDVRLQSNPPVEITRARVICRGGFGGPTLLKLVAGKSTGGFVDVFIQVEK